MTQWILTSCILIVAVLLIRAIGRDKLSARIRYALWGLVLLRLLVPGSVGATSLSILNVVPDAEVVQEIQTVSEEQQQLREQINMLEEQVRNSEQLTSDTAVPPESSQTSQVSEAMQWIESNDDNQPNEAIAAMETVRTSTGFLFIVWGVGMVLAGGMFLLSNLQFLGHLRRNREYLMTAAVPVYKTNAVETPCLFGFIRPAVYVTPDVIEDETALRHVLAHELTHYRHKDHIWSLLRCVCVTLHWYNPLVWVSAFVSQQDAELACDEGALKCIGESERTAYARTLMDLTCVGYRGIITAATSMTGTESTLKTRIMRIVKNPQMSKFAIPVVLVLVGILTVCMFTGETVDLPEGIWRTEPERPYDNSSRNYVVYPESFYEYQLFGGEGRQLLYTDGELQFAEYFTYTMKDNVLILEYPYENGVGSQEIILEDERLVMYQHGEILREYFPCEYTLPEFLYGKLFHPTAVFESALTTKQRKVDFRDGVNGDFYSAKLMELFCQAEVTKVKDGAIRSSSRDIEDMRYHDRVYYFEGSPLVLIDGLLCDGENAYSLSNIEQIESFLYQALPWQFVDPETDGYGMDYYPTLQEGMVNIYIRLQHGIWENRYYVPGEQSIWRKAVEEAMQQGEPREMDGLETSYYTDNSMIELYLSDGEGMHMNVFEDGTFYFQRRISESEFEYCYVTSEKAPQLTELMTYFMNLYRDSISIGPKDPDAYYGNWVLESDASQLGIEAAVLQLSYMSHQSLAATTVRNDVVSNKSYEYGVIVDELVLREENGTEYRVSHILDGNMMTIEAEGVELVFRKTERIYPVLAEMGDVTRVPERDSTVAEPISLNEEQTQQLETLLLEDWEQRRRIDDVIVAYDCFYNLKVAEKILSAKEVLLTDIGGLFVDGEGYRLSNSEDLVAYLESLYPEEQILDYGSKG